MLIRREPWSACFRVKSHFFTAPRWLITVGYGWERQSSNICCRPTLYLRIHTHIYTHISDTYVSIHVCTLNNRSCKLCAAGNDTAFPVSQQRHGIPGDNYKAGSTARPTGGNLLRANQPLHHPSHLCGCKPACVALPFVRQAAIAHVKASNAAARRLRRGGGFVAYRWGAVCMLHAPQACDPRRTG